MGDSNGPVIEVKEDECNSDKTEASVVLKTTSNFGSANGWEPSHSPVSPYKDVKSTAVVKYSTVPSLANFAVLQCNTDLNSPPSNWLSSSADSYGLQHVPSHSTGFSSFRMAHMFPECVGEVDVVSDAENIKKLLKIPYSKGPVSMMVHRIENTLLIDEFDIHKYLLRTAESEWEWLRKFFFEQVLQSLNEKEKALPHKNKSRCALQQKSLVSKFLYHSLSVEQSQEDPSPEEPRTETQNPPETDAENTSQNNDCRISDSNNTKTETEAAVPIPVPKPDPPLPEPDLEGELPDPASKSTFTRTLVWTFEEIQMLIGTNLPIFGGKTHPCVSLKLRDMSKPINVLTGIDYWLDNLMCNVPELLMCYHLDGLVQKYELIKTEDLPNMENSTFSPKVIRDVAQNILSFLKSNATKAGHTYWLFKGRDADFVKLYDLTSLCFDMMDDKGQNPFIVPVGMLLYRVARNLKHSEDGERQRGTIRLLLNNCIDLLTKEKYPQIVTSAHYMLADLYIPSDTDPAAPELKVNVDDKPLPSEFDDEAEAEHEGDESGLGSSSVHVQSLCVATSFSPCGSAPPPPLCTDVEERCSSALEQVAFGLHCLFFFDCEEAKNSWEKDTEKKEQENENDTPNMAKPFEAIPMPYTPLKGQRGKGRTGSPAGSFKKVKKAERVQKLRSPRSLLCKYHTEAMPTWQQPKPSDKVFWRAHLRILLYEKACLVYATLAETRHSKGSFGAALKYIAMVLKCQLQLHGWPNSAQNYGLQSYLLGRAGDLCFMIVQDWVNVKKHRKEFKDITDVDKLVLKEIAADNQEKEEGSSLLKFIPRKLTSIEDILIASLECYAKALSLEPVDLIRNNLKRRLGNIENEIGVMYMNQASTCYEETSATIRSYENEALQALLKKSLDHLEHGIKLFEEVRDEANLALLHSNTGRLLRLWGHYQCPDPKKRNQMVGPEKNFYNKALVSYQKALQVLGARKNNPQIWDTVYWELSTALFGIATMAQDHPVVKPGQMPEDVQREVIELFLKALKYCDCETPGSRQPVYQFRAATIHHRLAAMYHNSIRFLPLDDSKRKSLMQLSRINYEKSCNMFMDLEYPKEYFRVLMERVALAENLAFCGTNAGRVKCLMNALLVMSHCIPMLRFLAENVIAEVCPDSDKPEKPSDVPRKHIKMPPATPCEKYRKPSKFKTVEEKQKLIGVHTAEDTKVQLEHMDELLCYVEQRLQYVLLHLVKLHHCVNDKAKKEAHGNEVLFKQLYGLTLRKPGPLSVKEMAAHLLSILEQVDSVVCQPSSALKTR